MPGSSRQALSHGSRARATVALAAVVLGTGACGSEERPQRPDAPAARPQDRPADAGTGSSAPPPPDAGTSAGHGADPARVTVPETDDSPPSARIVLAARDGRALSEATVDDPAPRRKVALPEPVFVATATGEDRESGVARARVSFKARLRCRDRGSGREFTRPRIRYFPPPQIERVRTAPGARLPVGGRRSRELRLEDAWCGRGGRLVAADAEVWSETVNGLGLEAVTRHVHLEYRPPE